MRMPQKKGIFRLPSGYKTHFNAAETVTKGQLESCLRSLESRPQWWTSYSNSRQNAVVICQAARFENEREEIIALHRSIIEGSIKLDRGLQEALKEAAAGSFRYKEFIHAVEDMRSKLVGSMEETELHFKTTFEKLVLDMSAYVSSIIEPMASAIRGLHGSAASLDRRLSDVESALTGSQMIAEDLRSAQLGQTELLEHLLTNMRIAQALADKQTAAAANLQAMVDDVAERYREVPAFRGLFGSYPAQTVYSLLVGFVGAQSLKAATVLLVVAIYHIATTNML
ncbi:hypothetical protein AnigIFM63604_002065 [Aspergillus niger]|uniref:Nuclear membrane fusion protein Kar5 n=1 Tax=Aspergillus niger TaxID=5061 RepID=A0A3F3RU04_ASPNG|nr:hypothetical protein AnigIFM59636_006695 [Aspergillus niger]GLA29121.1 hypothetical protein AnigIFM63326_007013 [Aspergillus niger]GLA55417.1 hypothetical protein AnigIFM63604_002065 [Aspergillus niger]SPB51619.1 unnamed protein product [Aspergillus niger]